MIAASQAVLPSHLCEGLESGDTDAVPLVDATPVVVHVHGFKLLLISVYMTVGVGIKGNEQKLQQLASVDSSFRLPWVAIGNWNCSPAELAAHPWARFTRAEVVTAGEIACTSSEKGVFD